MALKRFRSRFRFSRREALRSLCGGVGMLGLVDLLQGDAFAAEAHSVGPHFPPKAKNVILLFMTGGPSQVDLWDPKPALMKYAGQRPATADLRTERTTAGLLPSGFEFAKARQIRHRDERVAAQSRHGGWTSCASSARCTRPIRTMSRRGACSTRAARSCRAPQWDRGFPTGSAPRTRTCRHSWC